MRILIVQPYGQVPGHPSVYTRLLVEGMIANDITKIDIMSFAGFREKWQHNQKIKQLQLLKSDSLWTKLGYKIFGENLWHRYCATLFTGISAIKNSSNYDVIHFIDSVWFILFLIWKIYGSPKNVILTVVGAQEIKPSESWKRKLRTKLELKALRNWIKNGLDFIIHADSVKDWISNNFELTNTNIYSVIPWGIEIHDHLCSKEVALDFLKIKNPKRHIFLFFGLIHPRKNIEEFFEAIKDFSREFNIIIAGASSPLGYDDTIRDLIRKYKWDDVAEVRSDFIPTEHMMYYFKAADALVLNYGNFPNSSGVLAHAIEYTLPVLASNFGQIGEFVAKFSLGIVFKPKNLASIAESVKMFTAADNKTRNQWKTNMANFGKNFSWQAIGKKHLDFYNSLQTSKTAAECCFTSH